MMETCVAGKVSGVGFVLCGKSQIELSVTREDNCALCHKLNIVNIWTDARTSYRSGEISHIPHCALRSREKQMLGLRWLRQKYEHALCPWGRLWLRSLLHYPGMREHALWLCKRYQSDDLQNCLDESETSACRVGEVDGRTGPTQSEYSHLPKYLQCVMLSMDDSCNLLPAMA